MANDDDLVQAAQAQFKTLAAARKRAEADLAEYQDDGNTAGIQQELQTLANVDAAHQNLVNLANRYHQQNQAPPPPDPEAWRHKRTEEMTPADALLMIRATSQHGKNLDFNDPNVRSGLDEIRRNPTSRQNSGGSRQS